MNTSIKIGLLLLLGANTAAQAQQTWSVEDCMNYAVVHNRTVHQQAHTLDTYKSNKIKAIGAFLPSVTGNIGAQYNFGRAVDPETNTYTDVSTFYNGYSISTTIPLFDGFQRINDLRTAKADILMGKSGAQTAKDNTALSTFQAFVDVLYYQGTVEMAKAKRKESELMLKQTRVMEEVGTKGAADVAQMEAQYATDDYDVTCQHNLLTTALLTLKQQMNYPMEDTLALDNHLLDNIALTPGIEPEGIYAYAAENNPTVREAYFAQESARHAHASAKGAYLPSIYFQAGVSTSYYKTLHNQNAESFKTQFKNNEGEYIAVTLSIPLFNRLETVSRVRRTRNDYYIAQEKYNESREELRKLVEQALLDREGFLKESIQMEKKVDADSLAYLLTRRQYEEGLSSPIDVQTSSATLVKSRATLLQSRLMYLLKDRLVDYYKGTPLYTNE